MQTTAIQEYKFSLESAISEWIANKFTRTHSKRTERASRETMQQFRAFIAPRYDLLSNPVDITRIASLWADKRTQDHEGRGPVTSNTYNQRLAILSSFYTFVQKRYQLEIVNPIESIEKRPPHALHDAPPLDLEEVIDALEGIDRRTKEGKRDYAMLAVGLYTGRRASEITNLRWKDVEIKGRASNQKITLHFLCKGGKPKSDTLDNETAAVLLDYLYAENGRKLLDLPGTTPVWVSYSRQNSGQALTSKTLSNICMRYMGTPKVHVLRHTNAVESEKAGIPISEISFRLGHSSEAITSRYLKQKRSAEHPQGKALAARLGIRRRDTSK